MTDKEEFRNLLTEIVSVIFQCCFPFKECITIHGLMGLTIDSNEVMIIDTTDTITTPSSIEDLTVQKPSPEQLKALLMESIQTLCRDCLIFNKTIRIECLFGFNVDQKDLLVISVDETICQDNSSVKSEKDTQGLLVVETSLESNDIKHKNGDSLIEINNVESEKNTDSSSKKHPKIDDTSIQIDHLKTEEGGDQKTISKKRKLVPSQYNNDLNDYKDDEIILIKEKVKRKKISDRKNDNDHAGKTTSKTNLIKNLDQLMKETSEVNSKNNHRKSPVIKKDESTESKEQVPPIFITPTINLLQPTVVLEKEMVNVKTFENFLKNKVTSDPLPEKKKKLPPNYVIPEEIRITINNLIRDGHADAQYILDYLNWNNFEEVPPLSLISMIIKMQKSGKIRKGLPSSSSPSTPAANANVVSPQTVIKTEDGCEKEVSSALNVKKMPKHWQTVEDNEELRFPFDEGWTRLVCMRSSGKPGSGDVYYITPEKKKLRSLQEIKKYLENSGSQLSVDCFSFFKGLIYKEPFDQVKEAKIV